MQIDIRYKSGKPERSGHLGDLDIEGKILLKWIKKK
jgi:hypothetical protein